MSLRFTRRRFLQTTAAAGALSFWSGLPRALAKNDSGQSRRLLERKEFCGDPQVEEAMAEGHEAFRERVYRRILSELVGLGLINRCPACRRVVRTPQARQCFWCGHDWHDSK